MVHGLASDMADGANVNGIVALVKELHCPDMLDTARYGVWQASGSFVTWLFCLCMASVLHQLVLDRHIIGTIAQQLPCLQFSFSCHLDSDYYCHDAHW
jgi:hypothetical protein